jgi:hypothetical protein
MPDDKKGTGRIATTKPEGVKMHSGEALAPCPYCDSGELFRNLLIATIECNKCEFRLNRTDLAQATNAGRFDEMVKQKVAKMRADEGREDTAIEVLKKFDKKKSRRKKRKIRIK